MRFFITLVEPAVTSCWQRPDWEVCRDFNPYWESPASCLGIYVDSSTEIRSQGPLHCISGRAEYCRDSISCCVRNHCTLDEAGFSDRGCLQGSVEKKCCIVVSL